MITGPLTPFGAYDVTAPANQAPYLPHPVSYFLYVAADVELVGPLDNPADGEQMVGVLALPPRQAVDYLAEFDTGSAVLPLAIEFGLAGPDHSR
ncbi:hypothetical protein [Microlunatus parietis]|uniref:Uncharacterized protein n=1 Tax=Microlunatus parietis TaxID=682979 RepID=A0A7Y9L9Y4_9ACTN|nr:hypothetical protein [Microlunatus parietis]NYE70082.1 hypothetical protein [Microlunatus parietis]